jgi:DNA-binding NtrC family response regulator
LRLAIERVIPRQRRATIASRPGAIHGRPQRRQRQPVPDIAGPSAALDELRRSIVRAAAAPFAVLVEGESGVGKELVARAIIGSVRVRPRRFCDVNCAALPDDLVEPSSSVTPAAPTPARRATVPGLFEEASGGTLFLDEVPELSARAQPNCCESSSSRRSAGSAEAVTPPHRRAIVAADNRACRTR